MSRCSNVETLLRNSKLSKYPIQGTGLVSSSKLPKYAKRCQNYTDASVHTTTGQLPRSTDKDFRLCDISSYNKSKGRSGGKEGLSPHSPFGYSSRLTERSPNCSEKHQALTVMEQLSPFPHSHLYHWVSLA